MADYSSWEQKSKLIRKLCLDSTSAAGSGHPTTCLSAADMTTVLFDKYFRYDLSNPLNLTNDRFVLSKGHAAPLLYALFAVSGAYPLEDLKTLRKFGSRYEGHPTPEFPFAEAATGSLGQGLSIACGLAYFGKHGGLENKTYVLMGDGELAEGQIWEAANFAAHYKLDNLIAIADINRLGQSQETMHGHDISVYERKFEAFGFQTIVIDGHNFDEIEKAFDLATGNISGKPSVILAKTVKGKGISFLEDLDNWHGKALKNNELMNALKEVGEVDESLRFSLKRPHELIKRGETDQVPVKTVKTTYTVGEEIATREVYGVVLAELAKTNFSIYALDADVKNSTFSQDFMNVHPERFIECFIAEQNMVGVAVGLSRLQRTPFVSTFAAFLTRAFDQIRMAAISQANIKFVGSHAGVSIGEDGASQMGLEDIALFSSLPESIVLQPSDATSAAKLLGKMSEHYGISYLRTLRPKTPVIYSSEEEFTLGGSKVLRSSDHDILTIVASGITVHEAVKAYEKLQKEQIFIRVVDAYSIKPIDKATLMMCLKETKERTILSVEDHFDHGGLGDAVLGALSTANAKVVKIAVTHFAHSGSKDELLEDEGISAEQIVAKIKELLSS